MASLSSAIAERRKRLALIEQEAASIRDDILALEKAESILKNAESSTLYLPFSPPVLRTTSSEETPISDPRKSAGKTPGAISHQWRRILARLLPLEKKHTYHGVQEAAIREGLNIEIGSIRGRVRKFVTEGYLRFNRDIGSGDDFYISVTPEAVRKFKLDSILDQAASSIEEDAA